MDFSSALRRIKDGQKMARYRWGAGQFVFLVPESVIRIVADRPLGKALPHQIGEEVTYCAHIDKRTSSGEIVPWLASQNDILANDWVIVN